MRLSVAFAERESVWSTARVAPGLAAWIGVGPICLGQAIGQSRDKCIRTGLAPLRWRGYAEGASRHIHWF